MKIIYLCLIISFLHTGCRKIEAQNNNMNTQTIEITSILGKEIRNNTTMNLNLNVIYEKNLIEIGNLSIKYLDNYNVNIVDGIDYVYKTILKNDTPLRLDIMYFNKNLYFDGLDSSYNTNNFNALNDYINGKSNDMSKFYGIFRKNNVNNVNIAERLALCEYELLDIKFKRQICIIDNDYVFIITILNEDVKEKFIKGIPEYFVDGSDYITPRDGEKIYRWDDEKLNELEKKFQSYDIMPSIINDLFIETNEIINSIRINNKRR